MRTVRRGAVLALVALAVSVPAASAQRYAPPDTPGPPLSIPTAKLAAALTCGPGVDRGAKRGPVLMMPGTTISPEQNFGWNWFRALAARGIPYCSVRSPGDTMADVQENGEYVVYAIRELHRRTGRKVQIVGHSQGGMVPRWALRFWPDTRELVDDVAGMAPSNHGTAAAIPLCATGCAPAIFQQRSDSRFTAALNSFQETFAGVDYTSAYTRLDQVVVPNLDEASGSSSLRTGTGRRANVATQDICPANAAEHLAIGTYDPVGYAIVMDALTHPGPAVASRIDRSVCTQAFQPGVNPASFATDAAAAGAYLARVLATYPHVSREPALKCYVTADCPGQRPVSAACLNSRGGVSGSRLGPAVLGRSVRVQRRHFTGKRLRTRARMDRYCATGGGSFRIGYLKGRAALILTSSRRFSVARVTPGASVRTLRARVKGERRLRVGRNTWFVAPGRGARLVFRVRGDRVRAVGIAPKRLTRTAAARKRLLTAWRLAASA